MRAVTPAGGVGGIPPAASAPPRPAQRQADLSTGDVAVENADLVWAAMVLHHLPDPARLLGHLRQRIRPGGFIALAEFGSPLRFLPEDAALGYPGFLDRVGEAMGRAIIGQRECTVDIPAPLGPSQRAWVQLTLERVRELASGLLEPADRATLDRLLDPAQPGSVSRRPDARIHTSRNVFLARRP